MCYILFCQISDVRLYSSTNNTLVVRRKKLVAMGITLFCYTRPIMIDRMEYIITRVIVLLAKDSKIVLSPFHESFSPVVRHKSDLDDKLMINVVQLKEIKGTLSQNQEVPI